MHFAGQLDRINLMMLAERTAGTRENATRLWVKMRGLPDAAAGNAAKLIIERNLEVLEPFALQGREEEEQRARMAAAVDQRDWPMPCLCLCLCLCLSGVWVGSCRVGSQDLRSSHLVKV